MRIFWKEEEYQLVAERAAVLRLDQVYQSWGQTICEAQKVLPSNRRRPEHTMMNNGKSLFEKRVVKRMEEISAERMAEAKAKRDAPKTVQSIPAENHAAKPEEIPAKMGADELLGKTIEYIAEDFKQKLLEAFKRKTLEAMDEMGAIAAQLKPTVSAMKDVSLHTGVEKSTSDVKRMKIGIVGGSEKQGDQQIIMDGFEDVYDFKFVDNLNQLDRIRHCDLVLIRTSYCNHGMTEGIRRVVDKAKIVLLNKNYKTPRKVHEWLLDRYVNHSHTVSTEAGASAVH